MSRRKVAHRFEVVYELEPDGSAWNVSIPEVPGCHTYGRSLAEARRNIREALSLFEEVLGDDPVAAAGSAELVEDIRLPRPLKLAVGRYDRAQKQLAAAEERFRVASREAAATLTAQLGLRDVGELLGVSHQTVKNLGRAEPENEPVRSPTNRFEEYEVVRFNRVRPANTVEVVSVPPRSRAARTRRAQSEQAKS
jgi:predicted RNase H-like HicB family nuclease